MSDIHEHEDEHEAEPGNRSAEKNHATSAAEPARSIKCSVAAQQDGDIAIELLAARSGLSKQKLKDAMNKGAVHLNRGRKRSRLRRAQAALQKGDRLELFYDPQLLALQPGPAQLISDQRAYSVWYKPPGLLAQGTDWGDHCSLLRVADIARGHRGAWLVHRLDREASGLMLIAHSGEASGKLSALFLQNRIEKIYHVRVQGETPETGVIDTPLDDKEARSRYTRLRVDAQNTDEQDVDRKTSVLEVRIDTGRLHQIRRHLAGIGHPVIGDARYGQARSGDALALCAVQLNFTCPFSRRAVQFAWPSPFEESAP